jgi:hypothetical protein
MCLGFPSAFTAVGFLVQASTQGLPILVDAERPREGLDALLNLATHVVASEKFPLVSDKLADTLNSNPSLYRTRQDVRFSFTPSERRPT